ncbi:hypothetical protein L218DRAFT_871133 [Marasmius fiardii PR-910]|nr:hypothetical protein L218DRAFT_871133 [Marasmius fiardii PR-910]
MSSKEIHAHVHVPGRETKPVPVVVDQMLDVSDVSPIDSMVERGIHNPTILPDRFLFSLTPITTIRHPARVIPSFLRAYNLYGDDHTHLDFVVVGESFRLERLMFETFSSLEKAQPRVPIVVDGDKVVADPQGQMEKLCARLGIDESQMKYNTTAGKAFLGSFNRSTGVVTDSVTAQPIDMEEEVKLWAKEWNEETARILERKVVGQMEDYEYLLNFSL